MVEFSPGEPGQRPGLGTNASSVTPRLSREAFRAARRERFARRSVSSRWLVDATIDAHGRDHFAELAPRPATCGWSAGSHVGVHKREAGPARFSGVQSCGSVWGCACCGALIRTRRSAEVQDAAAWWEDQSGQFLFVTFTVRHHGTDSLERTMDALTAGFTATINGAPWKRFARVHGIRHFIKSQEVTLGWENGWHAHLHVLFFVDLPGAAADARQDAATALREAETLRNRDGSMNKRRVKRWERLNALASDADRAASQGIGQKRRAEIHGWLSDRWQTMVVAAGGREPSRRRGVDIRTVRDGEVVALYISKLQEGDRPRGWKIGSEMARQDMKKGRLDSLVPLELLDVDGLSPEEVERNREWWIEYVETTAGRRAMTWSRGLKDAAGIDDVDDEQIVEDEDADTTEDDLVIMIDKAQWRAVRDDADVISRILELVESDRIEEIRRFVRFEYPPPSQQVRRPAPAPGARRPGTQRAPRPAHWTA